MCVGGGVGVGEGESVELDAVDAGQIDKDITQ